MIEPLLIEVCVDSVASALAAQRGGAHRVELCSALLEGGVTPSLGLLEMVRSRISLPLHPIIRPRGGDFCYSEEEFQIMRRDVEIAKRAGADGVALGILDPSGGVDIRRTRELVELARPLPVTFHRAFDMCADLRTSLDEMCETGAARILTSGGEPDALRGVEKIAELAKRERIKIMAGGGITARNVAHILEVTGVSEIHVGLASAVESPMLYRNPRVSLGKVQGQEYQHTQVLEERVRELKLAAARAAARRPPGAS